MKAQMLKIAGVKSEKEFYKKFPDEASFMKAHGKEFKKAMRASNVDKAQTGRELLSAKELNKQLRQDYPLVTTPNISGMTKSMTVPDSALKMKEGVGINNMEISPYAQAAGDIVGGLASLKQQKQDVAGAKQKSLLSGVQAQAAGIRSETPKRQYIRPEDVVYQPEQMSPSYGVRRTNPLAEDGAVINQIGGNPTEIMNTFAPNTIYSDMGYEPLSDSDRVKQFQKGGNLNSGGFADFMTGGGGNLLSMGADYLATTEGYQDAGSKIGGGIGQAAGTAILGPVGGMLGKFAGKLIGDALDPADEQIARYNEESDENVAEITGSQAGIRFQNQFGLRRGGIIKAQNGKDLTQKDGKCAREEAQNRADRAQSKVDAKANAAWDREVARDNKEIVRQNAQRMADYLSEGLTGYGDKIKKKDFEAAYQTFATQNPELAKDRLLYTLANKELNKVRNNPDYLMRNVLRRTDPNLDYKTLTLPQLMQTMQKGYGSGQGYYDAWKEGFPMRQSAIQQVVPIQQENGGQTSEYQWVSHTWQPQVITHFGEHRMRDLLRPPQDADMLRTGGSIRQNYISPEEEMLTNMALGGQLETTWGGYAEPISQNPYMPSTGQTIMFRGQSHDESDGKGRTGIGVKYGQPDSYTDYAEYGTEANADVEVERNEPAVELPNGDGENSMVVYGNLKIPNQFLNEIGDPKAKGKKFKTYVKDLAKKEQRQNKIIDSSSEKLDDLNPTSPFDMLKFNSLAANIKGANMKLKQYADFKTNAAAVQNAINDTAEEMQLDADSLAKGKVMQAKKGANVPKAQDGLKTELGESISDEDLKRLNDLYEKAKSQKKGQAVIDFQREFHRLLPKAALKYNKETKYLTAKARKLNVKKSDLDKIDPNNPAGNLEKLVLQGNEDEFFGPITTKYMEIAKASTKKKTPPPTIIPYQPIESVPPKKEETTTIKTTTDYPITPYKQNKFAGIASQILPYLRPSDVEALDPTQVVGELYAMSQNQVEPVWAQKLQPRLATPYDISLQDILNENRATLRRQQQMLGYNPAAQAAFAAQEYGANQRVLGEQFRMNQAEKQRVYEQNRNILNQYDMANLQILDQQYVRQNEALSKTKATTQAALNSIASKIGQNKLENRTLATYENLYNYRFDPRFRAQNYQVAQWNVPTVYVGPDGKQYSSAADAAKASATPTTPTIPTNIVPLDTYDQTNWQDQPSASMAKKGKKVGKNEQRNSSIVKALKNL